ncbi:MAG TPA: signal peptidase II [Ruminiclostridium sp.]|nr:signal peptidase II [Ruminiclostridium sp.]
MLWALIIILGFAVDRLSKIWVLDYVASHPITVIKNFFYMRHLENEGAAFSILQGKTIFLIIMVSVVSLILLYFLVKYKQRFLRFSLSLIIGGALGNLYDRIFSGGSVVDFLEFHFGSYVFPTFNVADIMVVVGTILLAIYILFFYKDEKKPDPASVEKVQEETK